MKFGLLLFSLLLPALFLQAQFQTYEGACGKAILDGNTKLAGKMIYKGFDANYLYKGYPLLTLAIQKNDLEIIRILLKKNADIQATGVNRLSPLYLASISENPEIISLLVKYADEKERQIALLYAVANDNQKNIRIIARKLKKINFESEDGSCPLLIASGMGYHGKNSIKPKQPG